eukprot:CAMPEP_0114660492 /NCGR_PEP_ID=MMETSP0191-20121206/20197_1 /TAXON_ID=126664 /ORGANISM="Sorites sp." /LENGTH=113 /DNA_ID=CAMNT_0001889359 /DNA_START=440 /DNA_END=784 /DNA_ORIENTATION=-
MYQPPVQTTQVVYVQQPVYPSQIPQQMVTTQPMQPMQQQPNMYQQPMQQQPQQMYQPQMIPSQQQQPYMTPNNNTNNNINNGAPPAYASAPLDDEPPTYESNEGNTNGTNHYQ